MSRPITQVAVGILIDAEGRILLGQRPAGKPYAGYWEFPGGKIESGETIEQALSREFQEELGIDIKTFLPWRTLKHDYPHAYVQLHFCKIFEWQGKPAGCEGQSIAWQRLPVHLSPLLAATKPVLEWLHEEGLSNQANKPKKKI